MDHRMITIASPSMREYRGDVSKIDLQAYKDVENIACYQVPSDLGSGFSMENETSLRVHICTDHNDVNFLDIFLHHLVEYKEEYKYVKNLLFHGIEWQSDGVQLLCSLLVPGSSVKQLEFQKNVFNTKSAFGLLPLSEMLQRTNTIKSVVFSGCRIGSTGATLLASALAKNRSVEEFQVWEDSIGSKGAEELSKMIEVNYLLKKLVVLDKSLIAAAPLISAVVARNRRVEVHIWGSILDIHSSNSCKIVEFLPETGRMRIYSNINSKGLQRIACALAWNTTVTTLDMSSIPLKSRWTKELRGVLERNRSLRAIKLTKCSLRDKAVVYIAAGLFKNTHLESLSVDGNRFGGVGLEHLLCPISTFSPLQRQANTSLKILSFGGEGTNIGRYGITAILQMLETNQSLIQLTICNDASLKPNDVVKIFTSLERNATLRSLSLRGCKGVEGEIVLQTIMGTLEVNPWIEEVDLHETPLYLAGKTDQIYEKLCQNGSLDPPTDFLDLPLTAPTSCRVFLFGQELAGKNALHKSIYECMNPIKPPHVDIITTLKTPVEQKGTNEDKINVIFDGNTKLTVCNIGEQEESFALHDFMFLVHGGPRFFMILSSLVVKPANRYPKSIDQIEQDLMYWLKFLVSNARRVSQLFLPCVTIVLTHYDKVAHLQEGLQPVAALVQRLREEFHSYAEIYPTVFAVDARSSVSVSTLTHHLRMTTKTIVQQAPQINEVCNDMVRILHDWRLKNNKAVIRWSEYREICQLNIPTLRLRSRRDNVEKVDARRHAVAKSLHNMGEIIFFEELQVLIMDCDWFCRDILSQLGTLKSMKKERSGFVSKQDLEKILQEKICNQIQGSNWRTGVSNTSLQGSDVINMLLKLELCYELDPGNPNTSLLVPAILEESKEGTQRWQLTMPECRYIGRCLECKDTHMFLTSDFFPRLQVRLHNKIMCLGLPQGTVYNLEKNLIYTVISGVHVRVELSMKLDSSINVLACSSRSVTDMVRLLHKLIIPNILNLSSSMMFEESVIRSECVKYLIPHRFLQTQRLPLKRVKQILLTLPAESIYDYEHTWSAIESDNRILLQSGSDHARDILSDGDFHEVLHRRYYDLQHLATELAVSPDSQQKYELIPEKDVVDPSILGIAKGVEMVLQRLKRVEQGIRDLKEEISSLRFYEYHMVVELHRKMDYVMNYNIQLEERKVPQLFYFVNLDNRSKHLVTRILPGMRSLRVHMLCEFRREMHVVDGQIGCDLVQVDNQAVKSLLPYMSKFMKLLTFALKIGAHFIVGMGEMIPDLSREVVHLLDSSVMYGSAASAASVGALGAAALYGKARNSSSNQIGASDMGEDMKAARQWLVDFLKGQGILTGMDIAQTFGLWRVRYRDDGHIAWICRKHIAAREEEIFELPL